MTLTTSRLAAAPGLVPGKSALMLLVALAAPSACAPIADNATLPPPNNDETCGEQNVTWDTFADGFFTSRCQACHAKETLNRRGAPDDVSFNEESDALALADRVRARVIEEPSMPPGGGISDDERALLAAWLDCAN